MAEIQRLPVEVGSLSYHLKGFGIHPRCLALGFLNHQQFQWAGWCKALVFLFQPILVYPYVKKTRRNGTNNLKHPKPSNQQSLVNLNGWNATKPFLYGINNAIKPNLRFLSAKVLQCRTVADDLWYRLWSWEKTHQNNNNNNNNNHNNNIPHIHPPSSMQMRRFFKCAKLGTVGRGGIIQKRAFQPIIYG